jgi:formylglycine-generating enzyme required for sulfatase activity
MRTVLALAICAAAVAPLLLTPRDRAETVPGDEAMVRIVPLDGPAFLLARRETTVREYAEFVDWISRTGDHSLCDPREGSDRTHRPRGVRAEFLQDPEAPVVGVDWFDAIAFAAWRGRRLPSRYEWIRAAQASGLASGAWDFETDAPIEVPGHDLQSVPGTSVARLGPPFVGACVDMAGGVSEWCAEGRESGVAGDADPRVEHSPVVGGNWYLDERASLATSWRARGYRHSTVGFRCAADVADESSRRRSAGIVLQEDPEVGR